jgi:hypothetical protein
MKKLEDYSQDVRIGVAMQIRDGYDNTIRDQNRDARVSAMSKSILEFLSEDPMEMNGRFETQEQAIMRAERWQAYYAHRGAGVRQFLAQYAGVIL